MTSVRSRLTLLPVSVLLGWLMACSGLGLVARPAPPEAPTAAVTPARTEPAAGTSIASSRQRPPDGTAPVPQQPTPAPPVPAVSTEDMPESHVQISDPLTYRVRDGDTLWEIAIAHGVTLDAILAANDIGDPDTVWAGEDLVIPNGQAPTADAAPPTVDASAPVSVPTDDIPALSLPDQHRNLPALPPLPQQALLEPMLHDWQKMNNCAPTTVAMALSYFDVTVSQFDTAPVLKGGPEDKNVSPSEIVGYLRGQGFGARVVVNGDIKTIEQFINHAIPVIVEQWLDRPGDELTGHYRLVRGYDQTSEEVIVNDSYSGPKLHFSYAEFDRLWRPFNRVFIPVYQPDQEAIARTILGPDWDVATMYARAAERARAEIADSADVYGWFNLGTNLLELGEYEAAAAAYDQALAIGLPPRMLWYQFGPLEAYNQVGRHQQVLEVSAPLTGLALEELHYQRGVAFEVLGQRSMAVAEYQRAADLNPHHAEAAQSVARLRSEPSGG
jgi:LysM repeat protein